MEVRVGRGSMWDGRSEMPFLFLMFRKLPVESSHRGNDLHRRWTWFLPPRDVVV